MGIGAVNGIGGRFYIEISRIYIFIQRVLNVFT